MRANHSYKQLFSAIYFKDLKLAFRQRTEIVNPILFFLIVVTLFPLSIGIETNLLSRIAPGVIWIAALLSTMLSLDKLFKDDFFDGSLEQMIVSPYPLTLCVLAKVFAHWTVTGLPLVIMAPIFGLLMSLEPKTLSATVLSLLIGTPLLSFIGAVGAGLTVSLQKGGILISLLVLPLYIPVLIFATSAINSSSLSLSYGSQIAILGAMLSVALITAPLAISSALKVSIS
jgi:heme exporter protein B